MATRREDSSKVTLTQAQRDEAAAAGRAWAEIEVEAWKDQHDGSMDRAGDWVRGNATCNDRTLPDDVQSAWEDAVDDAAIVVWNAARDAE